MRAAVAAPLLAAAVSSQWLPDNDRADKEAPTYAGERCSWYDVRRLSWLSVRTLGGGRESEADTRRWPRLGALQPRPRERSKPVVCDGYGSKHVRTACSECPGDTLFPSEWSVLLCAPTSLAPVAQPTGAGAPPLSVLMVGSDHNNHGLFAQVERVLNQLLLAESLGLLPYVFLGRKVPTAPHALALRGEQSFRQSRLTPDAARASRVVDSVAALLTPHASLLTPHAKVHALPYSCAVGENQYFDPARGPNVWEYFFEPVSTYRCGNATLEGRPVRLLLANTEDTRRHAILTSRDAVTSYFEFQRYGCSTRCSPHCSARGGFTAADSQRFYGSMAAIPLL